MLSAQGAFLRQLPSNVGGTFFDGVLDETTGLWIQLASFSLIADATVGARLPILQATKNNFVLWSFLLGAGQAAGTTFTYIGTRNCSPPLGGSSTWVDCFDPMIVPAGGRLRLLEGGVIGPADALGFFQIVAAPYLDIDAAGLSRESTLPNRTAKMTRARSTLSA